MAERAAIVTGASSGIGLAIARMLGEEGYGVTMTARRPEKLDGAVAGLAADGLDVHGVAANVAEETEIQSVVTAHSERYGRLDVLVNNAGVGIGAPLGEIQTKRMDMQLDINLRSTIIFSRECLPMLQAAAAEHKNALVVNTASIAGKRGEDPDIAGVDLDLSQTIRELEQEKSMLHEQLAQRDELIAQ